MDWFAALSTLTTLVVVGVGLGTLYVAPPASHASERRHTPSDAEIEARVTQLAALGQLPAGWSRRDAARLLRIQARRARRARA